MAAQQPSTFWRIPRTGPVIAPRQLNPPYDEALASAAHVVRMGDAYRMVYWGGDRQGKYYILQAEAPVDEPNAWRPLRRGRRVALLVHRQRLREDRHGVRGGGGLCVVGYRLWVIGWRKPCTRSATGN